MLPITRATVNDVCHSCLQEEPHHDLQDELHLLSCFQALTKLPRAADLEVPPATTHLCRSCYTKAGLFHKFGETALCAAIALREMIIERAHILGEAETLDKFKMICVTCFHNMPSLKPSNGVIDLLSAVEMQTFLQDITGFDINEDKDTLPTHICRNCHKKLRTFVEFRQMGQESRQYIESLLWNDEDGAKVNSGNVQGLQTIEDEFKPNILAGTPDLVSEAIERDNGEATSGSHSLTEWNILEADEAMGIESAEDEDKRSEAEIDNSMLSTSSESEAPVDPFDEDNDTWTEDKDLIQIKLTTDNGTSSTASKTSVAIEKSILRCEHCSRSFRKRATYEKHVRISHKFNEEPLFCEICPQKCNTSRQLTYHMKMVHEIDASTSGGPWLCSMCSKECKTKAQLRCHVRRVHEKPQNKCDFCQREFKRKDHLKDHIRTVHQRLRPYQCKYCAQAFGAPRTLRIHEMGHTNERPFSCDICQKSFRQKTELKIHLENHATDLRFRCPICSRCKASQQELAEHLTRHNNTDGYQCTKCGRKFTKLCHLKEHDDAVHLKLRPFQCSHCDKAFAARKTLRTHERTHSRDPPSKCDICYRNFRSRGNLLRHMRTHNVS